MKSAYDPRSLTPHDVVRGIISLDNAKADYLTAERYYDGEVREIFGNSLVAEKLEASSKGFKIRFSKIPVDVMLNRTKIAGVAATDDNSATALIEQIRKANQLEIWENEIHKSVYLYGDAYTLTWAIEADDEDEKAEIRECGVKISMQSVFTTRAVYDDLTQDAVFIVRSSLLPSGKRLAQVYYEDAMIQWVTRSESEGHDATDWTLYNEAEDPEAYFVAYGASGNPMKHFRNGFSHGRPEHRDAYEPQNAIIKYLVGAVTSVDYQLFPQRYSWSDPKALLAAASSNSNDWEDEDDFSTESYSNDSGNRSGAGTVIDFQGVSGVGEFSAVSSSAFSDPITRNLEWMGLVTDTPLYALNVGGEQPSGKARKIMDEPLVKKVENRQLLMGTVWSGLYRHALSLLSVSVTEVVIKWIDASVADDDDVIEVVLKKRQLGVPDKICLMELGYSDEQAEDFLKKNSEELSLDYRITKTAEAAEALAKLGALVTSGLMSHEQFQLVTVTLLSEIAPIGTALTTPSTLSTDPELSSSEFSSSSEFETEDLEEKE